jgi:hypothetical protein
MKLRHEMKHKINYLDMLLIRQRLQAVMRKDDHTIDGKYKIRSLYFDNLWDKALREKIDGVNKREKFRIRYYNEDISLIYLEKKSKCSGLGSKQKDVISAVEAQAIIDGKYAWMIECKDRPVVQELYSKIMSEGLKPKTIVDYDREPFIFDAGNVRLTLDYNIRTGLNCTDFLKPNCITVPAGDTSTIILEVKWDNFLPTIIRDIVQLENRDTSAFSKYASCRIYG